MTWKPGRSCVTTNACIVPRGRPVYRCGEAGGVRRLVWSTERAAESQVNLKAAALNRNQFWAALVGE